MRCTSWFCGSKNHEKQMINLTMLISNLKSISNAHLSSVAREKRAKNLMCMSLASGLLPFERETRLGLTVSVVVRHITTCYIQAYSSALNENAPNPKFFSRSMCRANLLTCYHVNLEHAVALNVTQTASLFAQVNCEISCFFPAQYNLYSFQESFKHLRMQTCG